MVLVLLVQLDLSGLDLSELDLSELVCGLFVIAIGLILSKISFILNCGDSGKYEGFIGCLFGYSNVGITTEGLNIIGGCCGCCFLFLSLFSLECVLLPILTFTI